MGLTDTEKVTSTVGRSSPSSVRLVKHDTVTFRAVNAEVGTDSVATDSGGLARVEVTLGKQAGPALVSATVDSLQATYELTCTAGG